MNQTTDLSPDTLRIQRLNDLLRTTMLIGKVLLTEGIANLPKATQHRVILAVQEFDDFTEDNDPYGEHDFGALTVDRYRINWKIDYYAPNMMNGSEDPADPAKTRRVLTIMLAEEY